MMKWPTPCVTILFLGFLGWSTTGCSAQLSDPEQEVLAGSRKGDFAVETNGDASSREVALVLEVTESVPRECSLFDGTEVPDAGFATPGVPCIALRQGDQFLTIRDTKGCFSGGCVEAGFGTLLSRGIPFVITLFTGASFSPDRVASLRVSEVLISGPSILDQAVAALQAAAVVYAAMTEDSNALVVARQLVGIAGEIQGAWSEEKNRRALKPKEAVRKLEDLKCRPEGTKGRNWKYDCDGCKVYVPQTGTVSEWNLDQQIDCEDRSRARRWGE